MLFYLYNLFLSFSYDVETCIGGRRFKDKKEVVEPEADPERDQRTVFAYQVDTVYSKFSQCYWLNIYSSILFVLPGVMNLVMADASQGD